MWSFSSCSGESADEEIAPEDDTVSGAEMPAGQPLALDSTHNTRVIEHGLQYEDGWYTVNPNRWVPSTHKYRHGDTVFFSPRVKGYGVSDGKVAISSSWKIYSSAGKMLCEGGSGKTISRFPEAEAPFACFMMPVELLDSLDPSSTHFDVRYELKDRITGKSIEGLYRIYMEN